MSYGGHEEKLKAGSDNARTTETVSRNGDELVSVPESLEGHGHFSLDVVSPKQTYLGACTSFGTVGV